MKIYISGPITGHSDFPEKFKKAEDSQAAKGHEVVNPATLPHKHGGSWVEYMREDLKALLTCSQIYMLVGWQDSRGARIEHQLAADLVFKIIYQSKG